MGGQEVEGWCATRAKKQESANWVVCNQSRTRICQENGEKFRPNCRANCQLHDPPLNPPHKMRLTLGCCHPTDIHHSIDHLLPKLYQSLKNVALESKHIFCGWMTITIDLGHKTAWEYCGNDKYLISSYIAYFASDMLQTLFA